VAQLPLDWGKSSRLPVAHSLADGIAALRERYGPLVKSPAVSSQALNGVITAAERLGATHVWFEWEYIDPDWRDEFAQFYASVYRSISDRCERVHFLREEPQNYLGFVSVRPLLGAPVSRTLLAPPEDIEDAVAARVPIHVHPWGREEVVNGFPYISQDRQLGRCAHANVWMVAHYYHHLHHTRRIFMSHIAEAAKGAPAMGRPVPSTGLSVTQMSAAFRDIGLPAVHYRLDQLPVGEDMLSVVCRYLNSRFPVLLITERQGSPFAHVTVLVGYGRTPDGKYFFIRHDDERGPYRTVTPFPVEHEGAVRWVDAETGHWTQMLAPMPGKVYMTGEEAERLVKRIVLTQLVMDDPELSYLSDGLMSDPRRLRLRTYATESWSYKNSAGRRGLGIERREELVIRGMPRFVWVTEIQSVEHALASRDCVIGEFVVDATANPQTAGVLYGTLPGLQFELKSFGEPIEYEELGDMSIDFFETGTAVHW
jgi:hypothetical protein